MYVEVNITGRVYQDEEDIKIVNSMTEEELTKKLEVMKKNAEEEFEQFDALEVKLVLVKEGEGSI